ncbi:MAG: hypothetical protein ACRECA_07190, partial [Pseudolabrys sp.]
MTAIIASAAAGTLPDIAKPLPHVGPQIQPGLPGGTIPTVCRPDPAVTSITVTKTATPGQVQVSYVITNMGTQWRSGANQQNVTLQIHNNNTNRTVTDTKLLPATAATGAVMFSFAVLPPAGALDDTEFGSWIDLRIVYDPDITLDSNPCNDDVN